MLSRNGLTLEGADRLVVREPVDVGALQDEAVTLRKKTTEQVAALAKLEEATKAYKFQARTSRNQLLAAQADHADTVMRLERRIHELEDYLRRLESGDSLGVRTAVFIVLIVYVNFRSATTIC